MNMTPRVAVKYIQKATKTKQEEIGERTGLGGQANICQYLSKDTIKLSIYKRIIESMGWEMVLRKKGSLDLDEYIVI